MSLALLTITIEHERDVVLARQRSRQLAALLGFDSHEMTRIATAVSEVARNAYRYARNGRVEFSIEGRTAPQVLLIRISDRGKGIPMLDEVLAGEYRSSTGMGMGIIGAKRLMDGFQIRSSPQGTEVDLKKILPRQAPLVTGVAVRRVVDELSRSRPEDAFQEVQRQNQELLATMEELRRRQEELIRVNRELEDTNRGVVALYAELDERADHLRQADELKSRFLSNMSHEFQTPLNSILALGGLLLARTDGDLTPEQEKQIGYIRKAAKDLSDLVLDLLDMAKVEAGRVDIRPTRFEIESLFGALRGMLRPLLLTSSVELIFEEPEGLPVMETDEAKVSQILRNFISNALKFTEQGHVLVRAEVTPDGKSVSFVVADTGIGIAPADQQKIFEDFTQLDNPIQRRVRGTGLGLPLARKLAALLGGSVGLTSEPEKGSTFTATIPIRYSDARQPAPPAPQMPEEHEEIAVLVVEDSPEDALVYQKYLRDTPYHVFTVGTLHHAREVLERFKPRMIILDILLRGTDTWELLAQLKSRDSTRDIPVVVITTVDDERKALALGADEFAIKPISRRWLLEQVQRFCSSGARPAPAPAPDPRRPVLVVEDSEETLEVYERYFRDTGFRMVRAGTVYQARQILRELEPAAVLLDIMLPGGSSWEFLAELKADPRRRHVPVLVVTVLDEERKALALGADDYCAKPVEGPCLLEKLRALAARVPGQRVLLIDNDETERYLVRAALTGSPYHLIEAEDGPQGLRRAADERPQAIILDLLMPGMDGFEVLDRLKADPATRDVPVIIRTTADLQQEERERISSAAQMILDKSSASSEEAAVRLRDALSEVMGEWESEKVGR